jgi:hypothetical protein
MADERDTLVSRRTLPAIAAVPATEEFRPLARERAQLVALAGPERGRVFIVVDDDALLGRSPECSVQLSSDDISRVHARLTRSRRGFALEDRGSRNGTMVNGTPLSGTRQLAAGDRLQLGARTTLLTPSSTRPRSSCASRRSSRRWASSPAASRTTSTT